MTNTSWYYVKNSLHIAKYSNVAKFLAELLQSLKVWEIIIDQKSFRQNCPKGAKFGYSVESYYHLSYSWT